MVLETRVQLLHLKEYCATDNHYPGFKGEVIDIHVSVWVKCTA